MFMFLQTPVGKSKIKWEGGSSLYPGGTRGRGNAPSDNTVN